MSGDSFGCHNWEDKVVGPASDEWRSEMLLNNVQCIGLPPQSIIWPQMSSVKVERPYFTSVIYAVLCNYLMAFRNSKECSFWIG